MSEHYKKMKKNEKDNSTNKKKVACNILNYEEK